MTGYIHRNFVVAIAVAACLLTLASAAVAQDASAQRKAMRERAAEGSFKLAPLSVPAQQANDCVRFRLLQGGEERGRLQGWYAYNDCEYNVNLTWCRVVATKTNACVEKSVGPRLSLRLSPFTDTRKYRGLACYAPSRPTASGPDDPYTGTRKLACAG